MAVLALEINDSGLVAGSEDRRWQLGPGYAMLDPEGLSLGEAARSQARLRPRRLHNRFWLELDTSPLTNPVAGAATTADLVCAQLAAQWQQFAEDIESVVLVVPGYFASDALGLLLGIARDCDIPVSGMVDTAVAALAGSPRGRRMLHLDAHLHLSVLTSVECGEQVQRDQVELVEGAGLLSLSQIWIDTVAAAFVNQTRFDPLHHAATEQSLFDQVDGWAEVLTESSELAVQIEHQQRPISAQLSRSQMLEAAAPIYERVARMVENAVRNHASVELAVADRWARLPGMLDRLRAIETLRINALAPSAALQGALRYQQEIESAGDEVHFISGLPAGPAQAEPDRSPPPPSVDDGRALPTHLQLGSVIWEITGQGLIIGSAPPGQTGVVSVGGNLQGVSRAHCRVRARDGDVVVEDQSRYGTFVNDRRIESSASLRAGDVLRVGTPGHKLLLLEARS
ncbi:MAG: FHA domain-containing protein [Gammaproteobacteria bacterium]